VVGADLRNELRAALVNGPSITRDWTGWSRAAYQCGQQILALRPTMLIIVEGLDYATNLVPAGSNPILLPQVVYSAHCYS
jgi:hypothetical protein